MNNTQSYHWRFRFFPSNLAFMSMLNFNLKLVPALLHMAMDDMPNALPTRSKPSLMMPSAVYKDTHLPLCIHDAPVFKFLNSMHYITANNSEFPINNEKKNSRL